MRTHARLVAVLLATGSVGACAGENLFSVAGVGASAPEVEITAPADGATVEAGSSLDIKATATAQAGGATADFQGLYTDESPAWVAQSISLNGLVSVSLSATLLPSAGQDAGAALVIVTVTDQTGSVGADTVTVTITTTNE